MQINTKTGRVHINKLETAVLTNAYGLLAQVQQYNAGNVGSVAEETRTRIKTILDVLSPGWDKEGE